MKALILYVFHEENDRFHNFVKRGIINSDTRDYIFIYNNPQYPTVPKWDFLNKHDNVYLFNRRNVGRDFGGWNDALFLPSKSLRGKIITQYEDVSDVHLHTLYDKMIFLNSTVDGPYLPTYCMSDWVDCFTLKLSDTVPMTGISMNFLCDNPNRDNICHIIESYYGVSHTDPGHIQSMAYSLNRIGLDMLIKYKLFAKDREFPTNKWALICLCEIAMSSLLRYEGYSLFSFMTHQGEVPCDRVDATDDYWWTHRYSAFPLYEFIFVKYAPYISYREKCRY